MSVPPDPILRAAVRWLEKLPTSGPARVRALFSTHGDFSDITPSQYDAAYSWIRDAGLLESASDGAPACLRVFRAALEHSGAPWMPDADQLVRGPDELPYDVLRAAGALGFGEEEAYQQVGAAWGKVDTARRAAIGAAGESALVELLRQATAARVDHVSTWSDGYGYDIAVSGGEYSAHLEVKSTTRRNRLTVYLSRHEYETMRRDPLWELAVARLDTDLRIAALATVPRTWLIDHAPKDTGTQCRWETSRFDVPSRVLVPGVSRLVPLLVHDPGLLGDSASW